jgi:pyruvate/2-oxoglutarate dehydrogenase complex dihydrolipoamide dehydrogenase (E3) component
MVEQIKADLCIIGAGSGGLSLAAGAAQLGRKVVLIERHKMGGDCLNYGCVPSKALLAAAKHAHAIGAGTAFGVEAGPAKVDYPKVMQHVREVIAAIEPNDSAARFEKLGVRVIKAAARFTGPNEVEAGESRIVARRYVIATGSSPSKPPIPGLDQTPYFTNETLFDNQVPPQHMIIIGGGPIGLEMAQAHRRLGARVTALEAARIMPKDDPDAVALVRASLLEDGIEIRENAAVSKVGKTATGVQVTVGTETIAGSHLLLAAGREVKAGDLGLEAAGVKWSRKGVEVDAGLRTANPRIYAVGDAAGGPQFTHVAGYHAGLLVRSLLFRVPAKVDLSALPWCTYTDPELAQAGLTEAVARERLSKVAATQWPLHDNDRAQAERSTRGMIKVVTARGKIVGATIVAPHAGDLIWPWVLAISQKLKLSAMASAIAPYPTLGEISKRAAGAYYTPTLFSARTRAVVRLLSWF